jgi:hypothetical protein
LAVEAVEKTGDFTQKISRGESLIRAGQKAADPAKINKGQGILDATRNEALKRVGSPAAASLTIKQEAASEVISRTRQEELARKRREANQ